MERNPRRRRWTRCRPPAGRPGAHPISRRAPAAPGGHHRGQVALHLGQVVIHRIGLEVDRRPLDVQLDAGPLEELRTCLSLPQRIGGWKPSGGGGRCFAIGHEHLPDIALGRPGRDDHAPARLQYPDDLLGLGALVRHEHAAEHREDDVEAAVVEGQLLGVALDPLDLDPRLGGSGLAGLEQRRREVDAGHPRRRSSRPGSSRCRCRRRRRGRCRRPLTPAAATTLGPTLSITCIADG